MTSRNTWLDQVKAVACLLIVCHHLVFYGPMSDVVRGHVPEIMAWLEEYARMAVQVFLVLAGYFAAASLAPQGVGRALEVLPALGRRYVRLCIPLCAALVCVIVVNETVRSLGFHHESVSDTPTLGSVLAHVLLVHSIGGWESLSAGVWYVSIDFQLYALALLWFWVCRQTTARAWPAQLGVVLATAASLWWWNRDPDLDIWGLYFVGAYGMGLMAWWATHAPTRSARTLWVVVLAVLGTSALTVDWRDRICVAWVSALLVAVLGNVRWSDAVRMWQFEPLVWVGERAYSIFLIHFPMSLLVSAEIHRIFPNSVLGNALGMCLSLGLSVLAGTVMYEWTERGGATWQRLRHWQLGALSTGIVASMTNFL